MEHFAGLDVSVKETSVCIVDDTGRIVREAKVASEPEALLSVLNNPSYRFRRIGRGRRRCCHQGAVRSIRRWTNLSLTRPNAGCQMRNKQIDQERCGRFRYLQ